MALKKRALGDNQHNALRGHIEELEALNAERAGVAARISDAKQRARGRCGIGQREERGT